MNVIAFSVRITRKHDRNQGIALVELNGTVGTVNRGPLAKAYEAIRSRILSGEYPVGMALLPDSVAKNISVSRTPVREALRKLEAEGLVTIQSRIGASVKKMGPAEYRELCDMRLALESYAAGLAAINRTAFDLREIRDALDSMERLIDRIIRGRTPRSLRAELMKEDVRFHLAVLSAAKNQLMKKEILRLHLITRVIARPDPAAAIQTKAETNRRLEAILAKHRDISSAIAEGDFVNAKKEMDTHLQEMIAHRFLAPAEGDHGFTPGGLKSEELAHRA